MRIAFIGQKGIPSLSGGVEKHVEEVAKRLAQKGHAVFVYVRNNYTDKALTEFEGVKLVHLPSIGTKNLDAISHTLLATLHALFGRYDVIHYQAIGPASLSWVIRLFRPRTALVATFHCQDYFHQKWGFFARLYLKYSEYMTCHVPNRVITVSRTLRDYAMRAYRRDTDYIPNGAAVHYNSQTKVLDRWGLKDRRYVLAVGRLIRHKGVGYLIEAFKKVEDTGKLPNGFKLVIVGNGFHTDDYVRELHNLSLGRENIIFTGSQNGASLEQLFSHAYLFVQPSESEGLSLALLEAMAYGLAPLVSDIPENREAVSGSGYHFTTRNADELSEKLAYLLSRPEEVAEAGKKVRAMVEREYSWDAIVQKTEEVYLRIIDQKDASLRDRK